MSKAEDHLVRTGSDRSGTLDLSAVTGLSRLHLELHRLAPGERMQFKAATERFLYELEGSGELRSTAEAASIEPGDFVALSAEEPAELSTEPGISVLCGES